MQPCYSLKKIDVQLVWTDSFEMVFVYFSVSHTHTFTDTHHNKDCVEEVDDKQFHLFYVNKQFDQKLERFGYRFPGGFGFGLIL